MADYMTFNEQNYLCHYGIKGMKWGIRRYQNEDGSLTSEGIQRYGSKHGLHKAYKKALKAATKASQRAKETKALLEQHRKVSGEYNESLRQKLNKKNLSKKELQKYYANEKADAIFRGAKSHYEDVASDAIKSLVKEFGKDSVKDILIDKKKVAKYAEKTQRIISSAHLKTAETKAAASEKRSINDNRKMLGLKELEFKKPISPWAKPFRDNPNLEKAYDNMTSAKAKYEKAVMMPHKYDIKTAKQEYMTAYKNYTGEYSKGSNFLSDVSKAIKPLTDVLADGYTSLPIESVFKGYSSNDDKKKRKHK